MNGNGDSKLDLVDSSKLNLLDTNKPSLTVAVEVADGYVVPITINSDTDLLYRLAVTAGGQQPLQLSQLLPSNFDPYSLVLYLHHLRGFDISNVFVVDRPTMVGCLTIYDFTGDTNFLAWLIKSLLHFWTVLSPVLYSSKVNPDVKRELWLHCPKQLLPDEYTDNNADGSLNNFLLEWQERNKGQAIRLNDSETFTVDSVSTEVVMSEESEEPEAQQEDQVVEPEEQQLTGTVRTTTYSEYARERERITHSSTVSITQIDQHLIESIIRNKSTTRNGLKQGRYSDTITITDTMTVSNKTVQSYMIDGLRNGPQLSFVDNNLRISRYFECDKYKGCELGYFRNGRLSSKVCLNESGGYHGTGTRYLNNKGSTIASQSLYHNDIMTHKTEFRRDGSSVSTECFPGVVNTVMGNVVYSGIGCCVCVGVAAYRFYDKQNILTRVISVDERTGIKQDTNFKDDGKTVDSTISYGKSSCYMLKNNSWIINVNNIVDDAVD